MLSKKFLLTTAILFCLLSGCKKDSISTDKTDIIGTWYYQSYDVKYYTDNSFIYDDVATPQSLYNDPSFTFNKDFSGTEGQTYFNYNIDTQDKAVNLTFNGQHFTIVSIDKNTMVLTSTYPETQYFQNSSGDVIKSTSATSYGTFSRSRAPKP